MSNTLARSLSFALLALAATAAAAQVGGTVTTRLRGFDEVPAISSTGGGRFNATINEDGSEVEWELSYFSLTGNVAQAHIHFAQRGVNGGISVFLCTNLGNGPAGTAACPASGTKDQPATVSGAFTAQDVGAGANAQGISANELGALLRAMRAGVAYANVHSDLFPGGEIRGQLLFTPSD